MGVWTDAFIAPAEPSLLPLEAFGRLVVDLGRERVVHTPWALLAGTLCANASLNWGSVSGQARWDQPPVGTVLRSEKLPEPFRRAKPPPWGDSHEDAQLLARGEAILDVLPALKNAPYAEQDVAVIFDRLDFGNKSIADHVYFEDHRTMLACYALARPQHRPFDAHDGSEPGGPVHPVQTCIVHTFKHAMEEGPAPALAALAARHFGPGVVTGQTWG
ncbi:hypothetical protein [Streptomyces flavofungini]|uniref:Uncharacterized protein n=1 Tax=Streptomyces flavofungini TaxID=68200 RepID=A0ABS0XJU6_9ACTN|nr:hypothetical protein [Streptomyces flavofungini]MBJ3813184.1 hypothetical protein [Streptomyces flavofungini]GHC90310.1 hypothetical protein GCM10010349_78560 [Streptomyces flavofungini]